ncbi:MULTISPECIES: sigma-70 family RNA polymerase sigma factor [unclassified Streptomyces]|uniref:sigma-70 family RNA polymerase sigma factor n=1 Tax=unclassified Streptomyces TaxID=2593676 RepID=UPI00225C14A6|nr:MULTISPECIES: sigma-70 family RNA polymerase sigma factor [unclassified Streptomyces]MCX4880837.1 sigma-70 family RNA polymerase sigma factor [Streptomyces sp. NBC_00847]MCX5420842.1 sigma-70 family RNA polymerase sigma factor [Streptomyces sp. NBC_00078]
MVAQVCASCGKPLPARAGRTGRSSVYCTAACRQKAYRKRHDLDQSGAAGAAGAAGVDGLIEDIARQVKELAPQPPSVLYSGATELSSSVARLRRVARLARDTANVSRETAEVAQDTAKASRDTAKESVTPDPVTERSRPESLLTEADFAALTESHRREIQVHCYRMTGSYDDAEDLVQETFLRAWRARDGFEGRAGARTWLYRIATNACLDFQRRTARRPQRYEPVPGMNHGTGEPPARVTWLQPYPDDELPTADEDRPDIAAVSRETLELVFLAAIQHLPPRQRAVLILRDVLGLTAAETAEALDLTVASANSALQRARPTLRDHLPRRRADWTATEPTEAQRAVLQRYMAAAERLDFAAMTDLLSKDVTLTMPPNPFWFTGRDALVEFLRPTLDPASPMFFGHWRHLPARANGQLAAGGYVRRPGTNVYRAQVLDVLRFDGDDRVVEVVSFEPHLFPAFGLPLRL